MDGGDESGRAANGWTGVAPGGAGHAAAEPATDPAAGERPLEAATGGEQSADGAGTGPTTAPPTGRHGRIGPIHVVGGVLALLLVAVIVASLWTVPYIAVVPGTAINADSLVTVPPKLRQHHRGAVLLTDVNIIYLKAIDYFWYKWNSDDAVEPTQSVIGPATPAQYVSQGVIDMANARQAATVVGLRALGYGVGASASGVIVYQPLPGSPGAAAFADNDVIVAVDGHRVRDFTSLATALGSPQPGTQVSVRVHLFGATRVRTVDVRLGELRLEKVTGGLAVICARAGTKTKLKPYEPTGVPRGCLGLDSQLSEVDYVTTGLPFTVSMDPRNIIGPSAGLAYTLALIQQLDPKSLTGGRKVAATGTMSVTGQVGDVGGVAQKTVAVRDAGASVFFVPTVERSTAEKHAGNKLRIFAVSDISQVLADLRSLGGSIASPARG